MGEYDGGQVQADTVQRLPLCLVDCERERKQHLPACIA